MKSQAMNEDSGKLNPYQSPANAADEKPVEPGITETKRKRIRSLLIGLLLSQAVLNCWDVFIHYGFRFHYQWVLKGVLCIVIPFTLAWLLGRGRRWAAALLAILFAWQGFMALAGCTEIIVHLLRPGGFAYLLTFVPYKIQGFVIGPVDLVLVVLLMRSRTLW